MDKKMYQEIVKRNTPREDTLKNSLKSFLIGGLMGLIGEGLTNLYKYLFNISTSEAGVYMIITLIFFGCLLTALGIFDKLVNFARCGLIIPITGFAHSMQSAAMEYRSEGLVTGIGANIFKLAGSVIAFGIISAYVFGFVRILIMG